MANLRLQREQVLQSLKRDSNSAKRCAARLPWALPSQKLRSLPLPWTPFT